MGDAHQDQLQAEAERRWGGTEAYRQSARRTAKYTGRDWQEIKAELESIEADFAAAMDEGVEPGDAKAMEIAERARLHIDARYYACSHEMHVKLSEMYTADPRFRSHYDDRRVGLAVYVAQAIRANAAHATEGRAQLGS